MAKKVVILIQSNPHVTARPGEAIRIALGLSGHHAVDLIFAPAALPLLAEDTDDLAGLDPIRAYLPLLQEKIGLFSTACEETIAALSSAYKIACVNSSEMAKMISGADCFMLF